jgi:HAD superfamily hydrolase (TIGR01509 family)
MPIRAAIFDLDGLMIDSEPLSKVAWERLLGEYGVELSDGEFWALVGLDPMATAEYMKRTKKLSVDDEELLLKAEAMHMEVVIAQAQPIDGLEGLIEILNGKGIKLGVASNSHEGYVEAALQTIQLRDYFSCVVTVDHVKQGKPHPEVYLQAARCLDVEPEKCLAIEDSPAGLQAAIAARMRAVAVPNHELPGADFSGAYARFESLIELTASLEQLLSD